MSLTTVANNKIRRWYKVCWAKYSNLYGERTKSDTAIIFRLNYAGNSLPPLARHNNPSLSYYIFHNHSRTSLITTTKTNARQCRATQIQLRAQTDVLSEVRNTRRLAPFIVLYAIGIIVTISSDTHVTHIFHRGVYMDPIVWCILCTLIL